MFKKLAQKKKLSSSAELFAAGSKTCFDLQQQAPVRVAKKEIPLSRGGTPVLLMPKPKHAIPPTQAVLDPYEHDKTEVDGDDDDEEKATQVGGIPIVEPGYDELGVKEVMMTDKYVRALQHQVMLIQKQCEMERAQWQKREEEHRKREREMMETIYQTQDQLRLVAHQYQYRQNRMRRRPRSTVPAEEDEDEEKYLMWQHPRTPPVRSRRNSASSFQDRDPFLAYHHDMSDPFYVHNNNYPIVRPRSSKSATPQQQYRRQRRPSSTLYDDYSLI